MMIAMGLHIGVDVVMRVSQLYGLTYPIGAMLSLLNAREVGGRDVVAGRGGMARDVL